MKDIKQQVILIHKYESPELMTGEYRLFIVALVAIILLDFNPLQAQSTTKEEKVDSIFTYIDSETSPGCAISLMESGKILYEKGYGMANLEYGIPMSPESVFHVASVSKQFTALAVQLLVNDSLVSWDDDIRNYVPELPDYGNKISLRHLVHHVSGLRDQWSLLSKAGWRWESDVVTQKDVLEIASRQTALNFEPGSRYLYSNTGYTLLAVVVERVSGQTLREFTAERIFRPLRMENTHFQDDHRRIVRNRAWAYEPHRQGMYGLRNSVPVFDVTGASSLFTTVKDLALWDKNFHTGQVGGIDGLQQLHEQFVLSNGDTISYAFGLIVDEYRGLKTVGHSGADAGYRSSFLRFPEQQFTISVLCNFPSSNPGGIARRIARIYLEDIMQEPVSNPSDESGDPEITITEDEMKKLEGTYVAQPGDRSMGIHFERGILILGIGPGIPLLPRGNNRFEAIGSGIEVSIRPPEDTTESAILSFPGDSNPDTYERVDPWSPSNEELYEFAGTYHSNELGTDYRFTVENGRLRFHHRKLESRTLRPVFRDAFSMGGRTLVFTRNPEGRIDGFRISDSRVWNVLFERRP